MAGGVEPGDEPATSPPPGALLRFGLLALLVLTGAALLRFTPAGSLLDQERLAAALAELEKTPWAAPILIGLWTVLSPLGIPVSPLVFAGGAVFGTWWGALYSFIGSVLGATTSYLVARRLGHDLAAHLFGRLGLTGVERLLERHGFWALLRVRLVPVPFVVVNYASALVGLPFRSFLGASVLGFAPTLLVYSYFSHALVDVAASERSGVITNLVGALAALLALTLVPSVVSRWRRRRSD
ncbi:MAG: VTT domain-containing protein [Thermoanaerobaculia bacterium]|nr:VTT domain-containing protein [Thermoanaerobaculia bacterium]